MIRIEVTDPRGETLPHYAQNILTAAGQVTASVQSALNDPAGDWTVTATDVASGKSGSAKVRFVDEP